MRFRIPALALAMLLAASAATVADTLRGDAPAYSQRALTDVPNAPAIDRRFWAPGLNERFIPQGVTVADDVLLVSAYLSADAKAGSGPTRIWAIDPESGSIRGQFDLPAGFTHAGGIAYAGNGRLYVADTRLVGRFDLGSALETGDGAAAMDGSWPLAAPLRGSFMSYRDGTLWIGSWNPDAEGRMWAIPETVLPPDGEALTEAMAAKSFAIPSRGQGAGFDPAGNLWISRSSSRIGELLKIDPADGKVLATFQTAIGVEDLGFDREGRMWTLSEAGSQRWQRWETHYPLVYRLDPAKLK